MKALLAKQPRSYWLSSLGLLLLLLAAWILFGILVRIGVDYQRNTQNSPIATPQALKQGPVVQDVVNYLEPHRVLWVTPQGAVVVPVAFALAMNPIIQCESEWQTEAVGDAGELGLAQIHVRVHRPRMESMGLDPYSERDRMIFAVALWREKGTQPWSCG